MGDRRRIVLAVPGQQAAQAREPSPAHQADERRPLLERLYTDHGDNGDNMYSCMTNPHSHLPVYTNIHRIRRDIISVVEDYLTLEQLRDMKINLTVVRPLVDKFYELDDISISTELHAHYFTLLLLFLKKLISFVFSLLPAGQPCSVSGGAVSLN